jgi:hypothetical protein
MKAVRIHMDETTESQAQQETDFDVVGSHCNVREYRTARQDFFAAVEAYRIASEEYLNALEANQNNTQTLEEKRLKRETTLLEAIAKMEVTKSKGEVL